MSYEHIKFAMLLLLMCGQAILFSVAIKNKKIGSTLFSFLRSDHLADIEHHIFSFDEALLAKIISDEKGIILEFNKSARELFGYTQEDITGKHIDILIPEEERPKVHDQLAREMGKDTETKRYYIEVLSKQGERIPAEYVVRKRKYEENSYYLFIIRDRRLDDQKFRKYESVINLYKLKIDILSKGEEIANMGSWIWDTKTGKITASDNYRKLIGLETKGEYGIEQIKPRVWPEDTRIVNDAIDKGFSGRGYEIKYRMIRSSDLQVLYLKSIAIPVKDSDGDVIALRGSTQLLFTENIKDATMKGGLPQ